MPALDPDVEFLLEAGRKAGKPPFETLTPEQARAAYALGWDVLQLPAQDVDSVRDQLITGRHGPITLRIYRGAGTRAMDALPCLLFLHGGGWVMGNLESHDRLCRRIANLARICVVAVDYRLAPEHRFPAALDDAASALEWVAHNAPALNLAPQRLAVGGDSAGGNLAAVLALMGRDGSAPASMYQVLLYPVLDLRQQGASYGKVQGVPLTAATMNYFIEHYTPHMSDRLDWRASPMLAKSLAGTPPALVLTVAHDPLCDEGRAYAQRLEDEGVRTMAMHLSDHMHGMLMHGKIVRAANLVVDQISATVGAAMHRS